MLRYRVVMVTVFRRWLYSLVMFFFDVGFILVLFRVIGVKGLKLKICRVEGMNRDFEGVGFVRRVIIVSDIYYVF